MKCLSRAARLVLIKSTLAALLIYAMQTVRIPISTTDTLDKICCQFFWGSTEEKKAMHTVAWAKVCRAVKLGGLGIPNLR